MGEKKKEGYRVAATITAGMMNKLSSYAKDNGMKESEVIKEGLRQVLIKPKH